MDEDFEYTSSAVQKLTESLNRLISSNEAATKATDARRDADLAAAKSSKEKIANENTENLALQKIVSTGKDVAREFMSIVNAGAKLSSTLGTTLTKGTQLELNNRLSLLGQLRSLDIDRMATMEQIQAAEKSFVDVFGAAREGMEISAQGATEFASGLKEAAGGNFTLTASAMQAMVTAGISGAEGLDKFKKSSGLAYLSNERMTQLVNKNSLSFMLYGPRFAKAAQDAEKLGISLSQVQSAQESMVTNLDGTIDTVAQINQLGGQIDFGTLTRLNEFEGPEATLKYLQSTIPPALFQSASTRALLKGFGISVEDLMKGQESAQKTSSDRIEEQLTRLQEPVSAIANAMAGLGAIVEKLKNSFGPLIMAIGGFAIAMIGLSKIPFAGIKTAFTGLFPALSSKLGLGAPMLGPKTLAATKRAAFMNAPKMVNFMKAGPLAGLFSGIAGYKTARESGRTVQESVGGGVVRGGAALAGAAAGAVLLPFLGPLGPIIGGLLGDTIGKAINEKFPKVAASVGAVFGGFMDVATVLWETIKPLFKSFGDLFTALGTMFGSGEQGPAAASEAFKILGQGLGYLVLGPIMAAIGAVNIIIGALTAFAQILSGNFSGAIKTFRGSIADFAAPFVTDAYEKRIRGDDTISKSGYGDRTLTTPNGSVALNNRDTVVAFADDMISGVRTLSLGSIAKNIQPAASDPTLITKINELIAVLQSSTTTINIDNKIQQVPRMVMAGVYSRNERV
jgi:hypothetical protein